jgi:hypothetical protein
MEDGLFILSEDVPREDILETLKGQAVFFDDCCHGREEVRKWLLDEIEDQKLSDEEWKLKQVEIQKELGGDSLQVKRDDVFWYLHEYLKCIRLLDLFEE